jgi:hypothetical protein
VTTTADILFHDKLLWRTFLSSRTKENRQAIINFEGKEWVETKEMEKSK